MASNEVPAVPKESANPRPITFDYPVDQFSATIGNLRGGDIYTVQVGALTDVLGGASKPSLTVGVPPTAPASSYTNMSFLGSTYDSVSFNWDPPYFDGGSPITGYRITTSLAPPALDPMSKVTQIEGDVRNAVIDGLVPGMAYRFIVDGCNIVGCAEYSENAVYRTVPAFSLISPSISGTTRVGSILTANPGTWDPAPDTTSYQWFRSGAIVLGATAKTYSLTTLDAGKPISVRVTATKAGLPIGARTSAATAAIAPGQLGATPTPIITGTRKVGYTLTANPGVWTPGVSLRYQWYRSGVAIPGAIARTYKLAATDARKLMTVRITGSKVGYTPVTKVSAATASIALGNLVAITPTITGTTRVGKVLTANHSAWTAGTTMKYQWYRSGIAIPGATLKTYRLGLKDRGHHQGPRCGVYAGLHHSHKVFNADRPHSIRDLTSRLRLRRWVSGVLILRVQAKGRVHP